MSVCPTGSIGIGGIAMVAGISRPVCSGAGVREQHTVSSGAASSLAGARGLLERREWRGVCLGDRELLGGACSLAAALGLLERRDWRGVFLGDRELLCAACPLTAALGLLERRERGPGEKVALLLRLGARRSGDAFSFRGERRLLVAATTTRLSGCLLLASRSPPLCRGVKLCTSCRWSLIFSLESSRRPHREQNCFIFLNGCCGPAKI